MEEKSSKAKGVSIVMILLAIVIGFGFVIGLTQTSGANNLNNQDSEISHYAFDENGVLLSYSGQQTEIEIPATYSLSSTVEQIEMTSSSIYTLVDRANALGIVNYSIENQTGNYTDEFGNVYYQEKYVMTYEKRKVIEGDDYQVTGIAANAFSNNARITSVTIPETVRTIGSNSFAGCTNLKTVVLPEHLDRIEDSAFYNCRLLRDIEIPNNVRNIGWDAFLDCVSLTKVVMPKKLPRLEAGAFFGCVLIENIEDIIQSRNNLDNWKKIFGEDATILLAISHDAPSDVVDFSLKHKKTCIDLMVKYNRINLISRLLEKSPRIKIGELD